MTAQTTGEPQKTIAAVPVISHMTNQIRDYDWGSSTALAQLQSRTPTDTPEAELWMGAHPSAPSSLILDDGTAVSLLSALTDAPTRILGPAVEARFGARLPFLLKILAIARPLSVQVHPDSARAAQVHTSDGTSPYVDGFHKPEMLTALDPTEVLFGFRPPGEIASLLALLESDRLAGLVRSLQAVGPDDATRNRDALATLLNWPMTDRAALVAEIAAGSGRVRAAGGAFGWADAYRWVDRLVGLHPADPMVLAPLLLDLVRLAPGQSVFVAAGVPHCYLSGLGIEILASSDNVLRAGLTSKPIAVEELLAVLDGRPPEQGGGPMLTLGRNEVAWRPPIDDFQLSRIIVRGDAVGADSSITGPQILLCTRGAVDVSADGHSVSLRPGQSAFVTAEASSLVVDGDGDVFRAASGLLTG